MREIKFRGLSVDLKTWVYGYIFVTEKSNPLKEKTRWIFNEYGKYKIIPESTGQYTGLKDKNGKEIYEGDILQLEQGGIVQVEWEFAEFRLIGLDHDRHDRLYHELIDSTHPINSRFDGVTTRLEIIGNIHENMELIEDDNNK